MNNLQKVEKKVKTDEAVHQGEVVVFSSFNKLGEIRKAVNEAQREYLRNTLFKTLTDNDILLVLYKAHNLALDVLNQEMTAYRTSQGQLVTIVGKDAKIRLAKGTGKVEFLRGDAIYRIKDEKAGGYRLAQAWEGGELWGAWAEVKRTDEQDSHRVQVVLSEYHQHNTMWNTKPETMIKKVAKSQVVTEAFPELFAGVYEEEEMPVVAPSGVVDREIPKLANGDAPADESQMQTIKSLGGDTDRTYSKQEAAEEIRKLTLNKGGNKS